ERPGGVDPLHLHRHAGRVAVRHPGPAAGQALALAGRHAQRATRAVQGSCAVLRHGGRVVLRRAGRDGQDWGRDLAALEWIHRRHRRIAGLHRGVTRYRALRGGGGGGCQSVELTLARMSPTLCERACTRWWPSVAWLTQVQAMQLRAGGDLHASGRLEQFADVRLPVFLLKHDVFFLHLALGDAPKLAHFMRGRVRDDEGLEHNIRLPQPLLDVLDGFVEADLGILEADVADAFGVDEGHALPLAFELPDDEVRVEVASLEEADATALAQVAQQVEFAFRKIAGVGVVERLQVLDEPALALIERGG